MRIPERYQFFLRNLIHGLLWLGAIVGALILLQRFTPEGHFDEYLQPLYDQPMLMYLIYTLSEIFFGVIPPELFMIWALKMGSLIVYIEIVLFLALISYGAGLVGYFFGRYLST